MSLFNKTTLIFFLFVGTIYFQNVESTIDIFGIFETPRRMYCQFNCVDINNWNFIWNSLCLKLCPELALIVTTTSPPMTVSTSSTPKQETTTKMSTTAITSTNAPSSNTPPNAGTTTAATTSSSASSASSASSSPTGSTSSAAPTTMSTPMTSGNVG